MGRERGTSVREDGGELDPCGLAPGDAGASDTCEDVPATGGDAAWTETGGDEASLDRGDADVPGEAQPSDLEMFLANMLSNSTGMTDALLRENGMDVPGGRGGEGPRVVERPLLPEEAQLVAERAAVQAALDDVRTRNHGGKLGSVARWAELGLAPAHMDDDTFSTFLFDCLEAAKGGAPFEGSGMPVDLAIYPDPRDVAGDDEGDDADAIAAGAAGDEDGAGAAGDAGKVADETADVAGIADGVDATATAAAGGAADAEAQGDGEAEAPREVEGEGCAEIADEDTDAAADGDCGADVEYVEPAVLEHVHDPLDCDDIRVIEGKRDVYLYSTRRMSDNYAHWAYLSAEGDDVLTLADNARQECKIYPRPLLARSLTNPPYNFTLDHVYGVFRQLEESGDYPDIKECSASNGDVYYYSTDYLSTAQAKALAEWYSVEKAMNV